MIPPAMLAHTLQFCEKKASVSGPPKKITVTHTTLSRLVFFHVSFINVFFRLKGWKRPSGPILSWKLRMSTHEMNTRKDMKTEIEKSEALSLPTDAARQKKRAISFNTFLTRLIWICVLPLVMMAVYLAYIHVQTLQTQRDQEATNLLHNVAYSFDRLLGSRIAALQTLAASPLVDDPPRLKEFYKEAQGFRQNFGGHVILADPSMRMLLSTSAPFGVVLPKLPQPRGHAAAVAVLSTGKPAVGDMFIGVIVKEPMTAVVVPVMRDDHIKALLLGIIATRRLQQRLDDMALPDTWSLMVLDGKDEVMARRLPHGTEAEPINADSHGRFAAGLAVSHWQVVLHVPHSANRTAVFAAAAALASMILIVTLVSILGGRLASRSLARSVATLTEINLPHGSQPVIVEIEAIRGMLVDTATSRDANEKSLRESEERYRHLFDNMLEGFAYCRMIYIDEEPYDFIYLAVNSAFETLTGLKNVAGKKVSQVIPGIQASDPGLLETYGRVARTGKPERFETYVQALQNWFSLSVYCPEEGCFVAVFDVITERKRAEAEIKRHIEDLKRSNEELQQFAYVASHDLQEPLRMVASYTQLLAERYKDRLDDKAHKYIEYAVDGAVRMQLLINDLLAYSRIGTRGKLLEPVDAHAALEEAIHNLKLNIDEAQAVITNDKLPKVRADASQLAQLFQNLISNSVKFRKKERLHIHISARDEGREWLFSVRDNGIGIDEQYADKIFVIFQRLHTKEEYPGSGIGLAICKKIVERHGGKIWFESEPGKGSTFFFSIPK
jgi:signal transduction histidine kinase